jgi:hypothetical protein
MKDEIFCEKLTNWYLLQVGHFVVLGPNRQSSCFESHLEYSQKCFNYHSKWQREQISFITTMCLPILQLSCRIFGQSITQPRSVSAHKAHIRISATSCFFLKAKITFEMEVICEYDGHRVHKLSQRRLAADWLAPRVAFHGCAVGSPLIGCQDNSRPFDRFSIYSKWLGTFREVLLKYIEMVVLQLNSSL